MRLLGVFLVSLGGASRDGSLENVKGLTFYKPFRFNTLSASIETREQIIQAIIKPVPVHTGMVLGLPIRIVKTLQQARIWLMLTCYNVEIVLAVYIVYVWEFHLEIT